MKAIIYTSNTGSTAEYAQLLGKELNLPVHSLQQAKTRCLSAVKSFILAGLWQEESKDIKRQQNCIKVQCSLWHRHGTDRHTAKRGQG